MPYTIIDTTAAYRWLKVSGPLTVLDFLAVQLLNRESLQQSGYFSLLIDLEHFEGWSSEAGWENTSFLSELENSNSRMAFVGDEKWRDEVFMFIGYPLRPINVAFFPMDKFSEAEAWLSQGSALP